MVISIMLIAGYDVSERCNIRPRSFDLIAKKGDTLVIIKVISHIDSVSADIAWDLNLIARYLEATPIIVGERARDADLERGVVYIRYGLFAISPETLYDYFVEDLAPLVYASPGGLYVNIRGDLLREVRKRSQMSLGDLASELRVSRRTISKYESGMGTTLDIAIRLEELFRAPLIETIELIGYHSPAPQPQVSTKPADSQDGEILADLERMGMEIHAMRQAPFQALALFDQHTILTAYGPSQKVAKRASLIGNLSQITKTFAMCVATDYRKRKKIGKTLIIGEKHLRTLEDGSELIAMMSE
jgi:putative transcriptional regulator